MTIIKPGKFEIIPIFIILLLPPVAVICLMGTTILNLLNCSIIIGVYLMLFGVMLLKDYKNLYLDSNFLEIKYTYGLFIKSPYKFQLKSIQEFKVVKYALQTRLATIAFVSYVADNETVVKKIPLKIEGKRKEFQLLLDELRNRGIYVVTEGDYWK